jgi:hypothetical protein
MGQPMLEIAPAGHIYPMIVFKGADVLELNVVEGMEMYPPHMQGMHHPGMDPMHGQIDQNQMHEHGQLDQVQQVYGQMPMNYPHMHPQFMPQGNPQLMQQSPMMHQQSNMLQRPLDVHTPNSAFPKPCN